MKEALFRKSQLERMYLDEKLSIYKIAKLCDCNPKTVFYYLNKFDIKTRSIKKIQIPRKILHNLYHVKKWPLSRISKKFSCDKVTIFNRMRKYGIPSRTMSEAKTIYPKKDFSGSLIEKAYMIGFRLGDLNVHRDYCLISVKTNTTILKQIELLKAIFDRYGKSNVNEYKNGVFHFQIGLNKSFEFLLPKNDLIEEWILSDDKYFIAFLAGYTDAEGNIQKYENRLRLRIRTYDKNILFSAHKKLEDMGIHSIYRLESPAGKYRRNKDCWSLSINRQKDISTLAKLILPHLKHTKRMENLLILGKIEVKK